MNIDFSMCHFFHFQYIQNLYSIVSLPNTPSPTKLFLYDRKILAKFDMKGTGIHYTFFGVFYRNVVMGVIATPLTLLDIMARNSGNSIVPFPSMSTSLIMSCIS